MKTNKNKENDYYVYFRGAKLNKRDANRAGLGIIFGFIGVYGVFFFSLQKVPVLAFLIITLFTGIGYLVGIRIFK